MTKMPLRLNQTHLTCWLAALLLMAVLIMQPMTVLADGDLVTWRIDVQIDQSDIPDWVSRRQATLLLSVPGATRVWAWGAEQPLAVWHDAVQGLARVTTDASDVVWAVQGPGLPADAIGPLRVATLQDDKAWVYSLTFDDGHLTVATHGRPELDHYGYQAGVAVIGLWMEPDADANASGFCSPTDIVVLQQAGWGIFNHSYHHSNAPSDITYADAYRAQQSIAAALGGFRPVVFTAPHVSPLWKTVIDENIDSLGLHALQLYAEDGTRLMLVDSPFVPSGTASFSMARKDIKSWLSTGYNYFDQAHGQAPQHAWVSLHAHNIGYDQDWYAVSDALAHVYSKYGLAGSDEVWMAPADQVIDYLVTRSMIRIGVQEPVLLESEYIVGDPWPAPKRLNLRQGVDGLDSVDNWQDTYIASWTADQNFGDDVRLTLRGGADPSALLLKTALPDLGEVDILQATLTLYAKSHSNQLDMDLLVKPMLRHWDAASATWQRAAIDDPWAAPGAGGADVDRQQVALDIVHTGRTDTPARSYTFDVTEQVRYWLAHPEANHGFLIEAGQGVSKAIFFASSSKHVLTSERPLLTLHYQSKVMASYIVEPTPEPTPYICMVRLPLIAR